MDCLTRVLHSLLRHATGQHVNAEWPPRPFMSDTPYKRIAQRMSFHSAAKWKLNEAIREEQTGESKPTERSDMPASHVP